jgi:hypothetical protein
VTAFHVTQPVRLVETERVAQPELGDAIGTVIAIGDASIEVEWPRWRSWVRVEHLEPAT